jgi:hypothetical protein
VLSGKEVRAEGPSARRADKRGEKLQDSTRGVESLGDHLVVTPGYDS